MNEQKVRNYIGQIIDRCETIKNQPPAQRYGNANEIAHLARAIRDELNRADSD